MSPFIRTVPPYFGLWLPCAMPAMPGMPAIPAIDGSFEAEVTGAGVVIGALTWSARSRRHAGAAAIVRQRTATAVRGIISRAP